MSTTLATASPGAEWISGLRARKMLGVGYGALQRLAVIRKVETLVEPGLSPRYRAADVARIASAGSTAPVPAPGPEPSAEVPSC